MEDAFTIIVNKKGIFITVEFHLSEPFEPSDKQFIRLEFDITIAARVFSPLPIIFRSHNRRSRVSNQQKVQLIGR